MNAPAGPIFGRGILRMWDDEKGFGFIDPQEGGEDVFLHISALSERNVRPTAGALIIYRRITDEDQRPRAIKARVENAAPGAGPTYAPLPDRAVASLMPRRSPTHDRRTRTSRRSPALRAFLDAAILLSAITAAALFDFIPLWVPALYIVASGLTFVVYAIDKTSAQDGHWRISEATLHLLEALGGWPGARLAQQCLRHKTAKGSYQVIFWLIVAAHVGLWMWLALRRAGAV